MLKTNPAVHAVPTVFLEMNLKEEENKGLDIKPNALKQKRQKNTSVMEIMTMIMSTIINTDWKFFLLKIAHIVLKSASVVNSHNEIFLLFTSSLFICL
jgi:hypothetical protein